MKDSTVIELNYQKAINTAKKINDLADKIIWVGKDPCSNAIENIPYVWKDGSTNRFLTKARVVPDDIQTTVDYLRKTADSIKTSADNIRTAELNALAIAEKEEG